MCGIVCVLPRVTLGVVGGLETSFELIKCLKIVCVMELWLLQKLWETSIKVISK